MVDVADHRLDDFVDELDTVLLRLVNKDRSDLLYAYYFGKKRPHELKRPVLGGQLETMRGFIQPLKTSPHTELAALGGRLEILISNADTAEDFEAHTAALPKNLVWAWGPDNAIKSLRLAMLAVVTGETHAALPLPRLAALHRTIHDISTTSFCNSLAEILERDPITSWLAPGPGRALPETQFAARALSYLLREGRNDESFALLFWQYQRIRCLTYRYLVQEPGTPGLDWFMKHYNRVKPLRRGHGQAKIEIALELQSRGLNLGALEARIGPDKSWANFRTKSKMPLDRQRSMFPRSIKIPQKSR